MKNIESVTGLVNCLFSAYEHNIRGLDWEEKILEYTDVINDFITFDTDLNDLYMEIRQTFSNLPQPSAIKKMFDKKQVKTENTKYISHPDNDKERFIVCYKDGKVKDVRNYVLRAGGSAKTLSEVTAVLKNRYDDYKIYDFPAGTTYCCGIAYIPTTWDKQGNVTEYRREEIA